MSLRTNGNIRAARTAQAQVHPAQGRDRGDKLGAALPPGSAGIIAIYDRAKADVVKATLVSAVRSSVAEVDGSGVKQLKAALAEAQAGMGG
jgi:hypothetical protein